MTNDDANTQGNTTQGDDGKAGRTFTQDQVNAFLAEEKRKATERFADYDDLKTKAEKFDAAEQANLSELEKERKRAEAAEQKAAAYEAKEQRAKWAAEIVKDSSVPASALRGSTKEELTEHFEQLKALVTPPAPKRTATPHGKAATGDKPGSRAAEALRELRNA